jgi:hypothetical protein
MKNWYKTAMQDEVLLSVTHITDDSTGMYGVGDVDFGISGALDDYLKKHGEKGKNDIVKTLDYLKGQVEEKWKEVGRTK